jgi:hypothetical protein
MSFRITMVPDFLAFIFYAEFVPKGWVSNEENQKQKGGDSITFRQGRRNKKAPGEDINQGLVRRS